MPILVNEEKEFCSFESIPSLLVSLSGVRITCTPQSPGWEYWLAGRQDASHLVTRTFPVQLLKTQTSFLWAVPLRCLSWLTELNFTFSIVLSVTKRVGLPPSKRGSEKPASDLVFSSQLCTSNRLQSYELGALVLFTWTHMVTCVKWQHSLCYKDRALPMGFGCKPVCFRIPGMSPPPMSIQRQRQGWPPWVASDSGTGRGLPCHKTIIWLHNFFNFAFLVFFFSLLPSTGVWDHCVPSHSHPHPKHNLTPAPASSTWNCPVVLLFYPRISFSFIAEKIMHVIKI